MAWGQWDAGWPCRVCFSAAERADPGRHNCVISSAPARCPPKLGVFERQVGEQLEALIARGMKEKIALLTLTHSGLGCVTTVCERGLPKDWRTPPVLDAMNAVLRRLAHKQGVGLIDTIAITAPMWDHSLDFKHAIGKVKHAVVTKVYQDICGSDREKPSRSFCGEQLDYQVWADHPYSTPAEPSLATRYHGRE